MEKSKSSTNMSTEIIVSGQTINNICDVKELIHPNLLQRLFKVNPRENAFNEINNLLATKPLKEIKIEEIGRFQ